MIFLSSKDFILNGLDNSTLIHSTLVILFGMVFPAELGFHRTYLLPPTTPLRPVYEKYLRPTYYRDCWHVVRRRYSSGEVDLLPEGSIWSRGPNILRIPDFDFTTIAFIINAGLRGQARSPLPTILHWPPVGVWPFLPCHCGRSRSHAG